MVLGVLFLVFFRPIANFFSAVDKEIAGIQEQLTPRRFREVASIWYRVGTGDDFGSKLYRYGTIILLGLISFFVGLAALLGAWGPT